MVLQYILKQFCMPQNSPLPAVIKSTYLNPTLNETVYMQPPCGVLKQGEEGKVPKLLKGLYRLKQAGRGWYLEMMKVSGDIPSCMYPFYIPYLLFIFHSAYISVCYCLSMTLL